MKSQIIVGLLLILIGQKNIFIQKQELIYRFSNNFGFKSQKTKKSMIFLDKRQTISKLRETNILLKRIQRILAKINNKINLLIKKSQFISLSKIISSFYFNSIRPNWFGCRM